MIKVRVNCNVRYSSSSLLGELHNSKLLHDAEIPYTYGGHVFADSIE